jgi:hypothetical protein
MKLLILNCSKSKQGTGGQIPALELYDGPKFKVVRKAIAEGRAPQDLRVLILSALHGWVWHDEELGYYDRTWDSAAEPRSAARRLSTELDERIDTDRPEAILFDLSLIYQQAVPHSDWFVATQRRYGTRFGTRLEMTGGGIGVQIGQVKTWLEKEARNDE